MTTLFVQQTTFGRSVSCNDCENVGVRNESSSGFSNYSPASSPTAGSIGRCSKDDMYLVGGGIVGSQGLGLPLFPQQKCISHKYPNKYPNMNIKYAILVKQFLSQMAFAKLHRVVVQQTTDALSFMSKPVKPDPDQEVFRSVYQRILMEHVETQAHEIWDEVFAEHNVAIVLEYYINIYVYLLTNRDNDPYVCSPSIVQKNLDIRKARVYTPETYTEYIQSKRQSANRSTRNPLMAQQSMQRNDDHDHRGEDDYESIYEKYNNLEQEKDIRNSVIYDVLVYIANMYGWKHIPLSAGTGVATLGPPNTSPAIEIYAATLHRIHSVFDTKPFYVYLEQFAKRAMRNGVCLINKQGHLEITESVLQKYMEFQHGAYSELYTIWLLSLWLSTDEPSSALSSISYT